MDLKAYIRSQLGLATELAAKLGVPPSYVSQMASGHRAVSPIRAVAIEKATKGAVTRKDLRSDWASIWPELKAKR